MVAKQRKKNGTTESPVVKKRAATKRSPQERVALRARAKQLIATELSFIDNPGFREMETLRAKEPCLPVGETGDLPRHIARGLPAHLVRYCEVPLLTAEQEQVLFCWMNYYKYLANSARSTLNPARPSVRKINNIATWTDRSEEIRNHIVRANTRLVISIVRKFADELNPFDELLSEGTTCLINVVDKFDFHRGFRFSTYATRSIQRELWRLMQRMHRDRNRYATGHLDNFDAQVGAPPTEDQISENTWKTLTRKLNGILSSLDEREQFIVRSRYGMIGDKPRTFQSLGDELGVCKERVRQLEIRALEKLYSAAKKAGLGKFELTFPLPV